MDHIGRAIRIARVSKGLSQKDLADAASVSASYLSQIEREHRQPSDALIVRIAEVLGMTPDELRAAANGVAEAGDRTGEILDRLAKITEELEHLRGHLREFADEGEHS